MVGNKTNKYCVPQRGERRSKTTVAHSPTSSHRQILGRGPHEETRGCENEVLQRRRLLAAR